jgi:hypothetical protein
MIQLGDEVKDNVTGFKGVVIGITQFLNGCARVGVQAAAAKDGTIKPPEWFDVPQMTVVKAAKVKAGPRNTGGPMVSIPTRNTPR